MKDADDYVARKIKMLEEQAERVQQLIGTRHPVLAGAPCASVEPSVPSLTCAIQPGAGRAWSRWWALCR